MESGGFGDPAAYPTAEKVLGQYERLAGQMGARLYICFAYLSRKGLWSPVPPDTATPDYWRQDWRKPAAGMLLQAIVDAGVTPAETLMVGDLPEDRQAAAAAGCDFQWANEFFRTSQVIF
jgi:histidinol phosphatase-like enzyme